MRRWAPKWGLVDQPAARKVHLNPTPLGGGIGIWLGVVSPLLAIEILIRVIDALGSVPGFIPEQIAVHLSGVSYRSGLLWSVIGGGTLLSVMGLIDDLRDLPWLPRLGVQFCVAFGLVFAGVRASIFDTLPGMWPVVGYIVTAFWIIGLINSFNFLDNMDGLSSGIAMIASAVAAIIMLTATSEPHWLVGGVFLILVGSLFGFLCHNWHPAKIFMGDSGSYFIGLMLASMTVLGTFYTSGSGSGHVILAPLCILAIPLYDFCSVMIIRIKEGRSPFRPDKSHFSHRLVDLGMKPKNAVLTIHLATLTTGLGGILLYKVPGWAEACYVIAFIACVLAIVAILETAGRKKKNV